MHLEFLIFSAEAAEVAAEGAGFGFSGANVTAIIVAFIGSLGALLSYRNSSIARREQARLDATKVDAAAYERARKIDQQVIDNLRSELDRLRRELEKAEANEDALRSQIGELRVLEIEVHRLRDTLSEEREVSDRLRLQVAALERRVARLIERLVELGHADEVTEHLDLVDRRIQNMGPPAGEPERRDVEKKPPYFPLDANGSEDGAPDEDGADGDV